MTINGKPCPEDLMKLFFKLAHEKYEKEKKGGDVQEIKNKMFNIAYYFNFIM